MSPSKKAAPSRRGNIPVSSGAVMGTIKYVVPDDSQFADDLLDFALN